MDPETPVLAAARAIAPELRARAAEAEAARRLPEDLARSLARAGIFRLLVPSRFGGLEATPDDLVRVLEELSRADGAAGWVAMIGATTGLLAASLSDEWAKEIYGRDPDVLTVGVTAPLGRAERAPGGHRVSGRWPFGSGCECARWIVGGTVLPGVAPAPRESAESRGGAEANATLMFFPADDVLVHDTWHTSGLRGTGSHDFEVRDAFVPLGRAVALGGRPRAEGPLYAFSTLGLLALGVCSVSLGIAQGALESFVELAGAKTPTGSARTLANRPVVQRQVGEAEAALRSSRAYVCVAIERAWRRAESGLPLEREHRFDLRLAAVNATQRAAAAVDLAYHAAGGSSIYERSRLARAFRDVHVTTQHIMVAQPMYEVVGRQRLGQEAG